MIDRKQLLGMLGTFWSKNYGDDPWVQGLMEGTLALQQQVETNFEELALSAFRRHIPVHHTEHVYTLQLDPANRNTTVEAVPRFGGELLYFQDEGDNPNWLTMAHRYGVPGQTGVWYPLPLSDVVSIEKIVDNPHIPTQEYMPEQEYVVDGGAIRFFRDPCEDGRPVELFMVNVKQDFRWIYKHFGYILGLESKSSETYRSIIDNIFNAYIEGASAANVLDILREVTGNILSEDLKVIHLNQLTQRETVPAVLLPKRFLGPEYFYGIAFVNEDLPIFEVNGQARFYIGGNRNDVERFWADFERQCGVHGTTVNDVIRMITVQSRTAVNPYHFFAEHIGRYHYTLVSMPYKGYPTDLTLDHVPLRRLTPPWSTILVQQQVEMPMEVNATGASDDVVEFRQASFMDLNFRLSG